MPRNIEPCVIFSDYPIKMMGYNLFLNGLGEGVIRAFKSLSDNKLTELQDAKLVVCDMNIMRAFEPDALKTLEASFPKANILFLEEDHSDMLIDFRDERDICRLGKLAGIKVMQSTLRELLLQSNRTEPELTPTLRKQTERT